MNHKETIDAINRLVPFAKVTLVDESIVWEDDRPKPTMKEINEEVKRFSYYHKRKEAYPSIEDQLDIIYHDGYEAWKQKIKEVKENFPKS